MPAFKTATVVSHAVPAAKFHDLVFQTPEPFVFKAGQFVSLQVAPQQMRAYSIAGKLTDNQFGLLIDSTPGGLGSQYAEKLKPGDTIEYIGPVGGLLLHPDDGSEQYAMLAIGCGIAPIKAMVEELLRVYKTTKPITLYFGLRYCEDIFWEKYFNELQSQYPNFHFKLCLSKPNDNWCGDKGHITDLLKTDFPDASKVSAYMCGNQTMAEEAVGILTAAGCPKERIYAEAYG
jgi:NAD(P)H-flavin reductase